MLRKILIGTAVLTLGVLFINNGTVQKSIGIDKKETRGAVATNEEESALLDKTDTVKFKPLKLVSPNKKEVRKLTLNPNRTVHIVGPIGFNALGVAEKISLLASQSNSPIFVVLSSPGGSVMAGAAVIAAIQAAQVPVYTICYGFCASMASMIHQYGTRRYVTDRSIIMFHPASARLEGNMDELYSFTTAMIRFVSKIEIEIAARIGWSFQNYKSYVANELWVDSDEAKKYNIVDQIIYTRFPFMVYPGAGVGQMKKKESLKINSKDLIWIFDGGI